MCRAFHGRTCCRFICDPRYDPWDEAHALNDGNECLDPIAHKVETNFSASSGHMKLQFFPFHDANGAPSTDLLARSVDRSSV